MFASVRPVLERIRTSLTGDTLPATNRESAPWEVELIAALGEVGLAFGYTREAAASAVL